MKNLIGAAVIIICLAFNIFCKEAIADVGIGSSEAEVISALGAPSGRMSGANEEIFSYPGGGIVRLKEGKVVYIDPDLEKRMVQAKEQAAVASEQKAKGLVFYNGKWIKLQEKEKLEEKRQQEQKKKQAQNEKIKIYKGGQNIDVKTVLVPGKVTIIDFYADWCGPCKAISPSLEKLVDYDSEVFLRKIDIVNWQSPVVQQHNIRSVPNMRVFNREGKMVGQPTHSFEQVLEYVKKAK